jgi:L-alanine-DL-glutamate epimerase-like enolase superfamily enzyme
LGGGIGLLASAHLLAAAGRDGMLEVDVNENPLREQLCGPVAEIVEGEVILTQVPGLGAAPKFEDLQRFRVRSYAI